MSKLRLILADDHEIVREGLKALVEQQADLEIVGEADNGRAAVALANELKPDVAVIDVSMPELNGLQATARLKQLCPGVKILNLTRHKDGSYLQQLLQAGSSGYVLKKSAPSELIRAIRAVAAGDVYLDPAVTGAAIESFVGRREDAGPSASKELSSREEEVLRLIAWGYANKEIGARMNLSIKTVEAHKANALRKTGMKGRVDIVRYALIKGWLQDT